MEIKESFSIENRRYLGSKAKLIPFIKKNVEENCGVINSIVDIFGGTGNVGMAFNDENTRVVVNDVLYSNYLSYIAFFSGEVIDENKILRIIDGYNNANNFEDNYFSDNFAGTYFSYVNCKKIGFIRQDIENRFNNREINSRERAILITSLLYAMDHIANTVGHYDAYRKNGDLNKVLRLKPLRLPSVVVNLNNEIYSQDANELARKISADLVYIDPPYNSRQYCDAYHLLENIAKWNKPVVIGVAKKMKRAAVTKSRYCTQKAPLAFDDLIQNLSCKYILVSYNNTGTTGAGRSQAKISDNDIISSLSKRGRVLVFSTDFRLFTTGKTPTSDHQERLFLCIVGEKEKKKLTEKAPVESDFAKSPLNYTGGKYKLLSQFEKKFPSEFDTFIDLFGGGFNVGANLAKEYCVFNDRQIEVVHILQLLYKNKADVIISKIDSIINKYGLSNSIVNGYLFYGCMSNSGLGSFNKNKYKNLRDDYNKLNEWSDEKTYLLLTLIIFAFNNQIRFNSDGEYNMPVGKRDFNNSIRKNLTKFCNKLQSKKIKFYSLDFRDFEKKIRPGSFVYCDPPYSLGTAAYNENDGWNDSDDDDLLALLGRLNNKNIKFALSNVFEHKGVKNQKLIDWAFQNKFNINYIKADYSNSSYNSKHKETNTVEVLITNY